MSFPGHSLKNQVEVLYVHWVTRLAGCKSCLLVTILPSNVQSLPEHKNNSEEGKSRSQMTASHTWLQLYLKCYPPLKVITGDNKFTISSQQMYTGVLSIASLQAPACFDTWFTWPLAVPLQLPLDSPFQPFSHCHPWLVSYHRFVGGM